VTREAVERSPSTELRPATAARARLLQVEVAGQQLVVKDYRPCGWLMREVVGPWLIAREARTYRMLAGCLGVPRLVGRLDRQALAVEHIAGRNAQEYVDGTLPPEFFARLQQVVEAIHARGVVHCDLKNRRNIVVAEGYQPYLVDFTTALDRFALDDRRAVVKARLQVGKMGNEDDRKFAFHRSPGERAVRWVRDGLRRAFKLLTRG
jgi:tRNA A-37 threonylcarbamoyl transferase component Bud32